MLLCCMLINWVGGIEARAGIHNHIGTDRLHTSNSLVVTVVHILGIWAELPGVTSWD